MKRRNFIKTMSIASAILMLPEQSKSNEEEDEVKIDSPNEMSLEEAIDRATDELPLEDIDESKRIEFRIPMIPENWASIPFRVTIAKTTNKEFVVKSIHIFSSKESNSRCIEVSYLNPSIDKVTFFTRLKLTTSQRVIVLVGLVDGSFIKKVEKIKLMRERGC